MQYIASELYPSNGRDFEIVIYKDNNNDRLQLDAHEVIDGIRQIEIINTQFVQMNGSFNLPYREYPDFAEMIAASKQAIIIHFAVKETQNKKDVDLFPGND